MNLFRTLGLLSTVNRLKGYRLLVNLNASQTRRRLKGIGLGVRKVESAGKDQAVVIHTATGRHLRELEAILADVLASSEASAPPAENGLSAAGTPLNLGPVSMAWLKEVGIGSLEDVKRFGAATTYRLIKERRPEATLNLLWSLAGAVAGKDWRALSAREKQALLAELDSLDIS